MVGTKSTDAIDSIASFGSHVCAPSFSLFTFDVILTDPMKEEGSTPWL
jgi:hypothetical protein